MAQEGCRYGTEELPPWHMTAVFMAKEGISMTEEGCPFDRGHPHGTGGLSV
jgi:hypothetical protein